MNLVDDQDSSRVATNAAVVAVIVLTVAVVGLLFGFATADLHQLAQDWVVRA